MSKELIRLVNCRMDFDGETVLDSINIYFNNSEFLTLLGPFGLRQTTTPVSSAAFSSRRAATCCLKV